MSFFSGGLTMTRFRLTGGMPFLLSHDQIAALQKMAIGESRVVSADGSAVGWSASDHILDRDFAFEKNVIEDLLFFALRVDQNKPPAELVKAYYKIDLAALCSGNASGQPSKRQKREAKESSRERIDHEAKDGRWLRRKATEVVIDRPSSEAWLGTTSVTNFERLARGLKGTFGLKAEQMTAGSIAIDRWAIPEINGVAPSKFTPTAVDTVAWVLDDSSRDFLGNEFLLWLWFTIETRSDTIGLGDGSEVAVMIARHLVLDCPRGHTGRDGFQHDGPSSLPEARRAIQAGKLPRRMGLTLVRHREQYELTIHAETLSIGSAKLPSLDVAGDRQAKVDRAGQIRELVKTLDMLYDVFCSVRLSEQNWPAELAEMQKWLRAGV
jgi:hypothetical protein